MNQTRTFLIFAWIMVAVLLWMEWGKEKNAPSLAATAQSVPAAPIPNTIPNAIPGVVAPPLPGQAQPLPAATAPGSAPAMSASGDARVVVATDVLRVTLDAGNVYRAELLHYPQTMAPGSAPVTLFDDNPADYYVAQSGWVGPDQAAITGFVAERAEPTVALAAGQQALAVPFVWKGSDGVSIRRTWTFTRGSYVVKVHDEVVNAGGKPWQGYVYRQLLRVPPQTKSGMTNPESYSFAGAKWYSSDGGYEGRRYKDFKDDGPLERTARGGWIALLQHHFFSAWIPQPDQSSRFGLLQAGPADGISATGPAFTLAPGQQGVTDARLWVGPKLVSQIAAQGVPGLERAVDYSRFSIFAILGQGLFWLLSKLHALFGNWGWAIIVMVCGLKVVLFPLSAAQYKSAAKMRRFQPRIAQLKERYGDDKQKFQMAMMELYKKEKINPVGGCLPILPQMIIFMALYWVLMESVELRQAPWAFWIHDLTARDPFFILPVLNIAIMWATQKLTPMVGMDPMQQKMMQTMPLIFGVILAFLPAGLVLYQVANGGLGLLQQWIVTKKYADPPSKAVAEKE